MEGILICGIVFYATYKIIELFVLQRGRRQMLQKMSEISPEMLQQNMNSFNAFQNDGSKSSQFLMLRLGGLALGIGTGWILGWYLNCTQFNIHENLSFYQRDMIDSTYIATTALCTGIALIIVYLIERKAYKDAKKGE
jgi:hypothetical protein